MSSKSYFSSKVEKRRSHIHGRGLFAKENIQQDELIAVKGGSIITKQEWLSLAESIGSAEIQITDELVIAPKTQDEYENSMMHINHSCEPNVGMQGQIVFVAMRSILAGEELLFDYAMVDDSNLEANCSCGALTCRKIISGKDWQKPELQKKYGKYFALYLQKRISMI
jgi:SET domain-containing protein